MNMHFKNFFVLNIFIVVISFSILLYAYQIGITGQTLKSGTAGCDCHGSVPSSNVSVIISGPESLTVNQTAVYSVTISGGPLTAAGTDIAASNGALSTVQGNSDLQILNSELTHSQPKQSNGSNSITFEFNFTAGTSPGNATIYANGNSVNLNDAFSGDMWNFAENKNVIISSITGIENKSVITKYKLDQNYPNPFNPSTIITYRVPRESFVTLKVYNILGDEVTTLVNENKSQGVYTINFNSSSISKNISSGVYFYKLISESLTGRFVEVKKMILLR